MADERAPGPRRDEAAEKAAARTAARDAADATLRRGGARPEPGTEAEASVITMHEPIAREHAEPRDGHEPTPVWLILIYLALVGFGGWYLGMYNGGFDPMVYEEDPAKRVMVADDGAEETVSPMVLGRRTYARCAACHQNDGEGRAGVYPPLAGSRWVTGRPEVFTAILLHGIDGPMDVAGETYDGEMPGWPQLSNEELAAVMTYVRGSFGNDAPPVEPALVAGVRSRIERDEPWTQSALEAYDASLPPEGEAPAGAEGEAGPGGSAGSDDEAGAGAGPGADDEAGAGAGAGTEVGDAGAAGPASDDGEG